MDAGDGQLTDESIPRHARPPFCQADRISTLFEFPEPRVSPLAPCGHQYHSCKACKG